MIEFIIYISKIIILRTCFHGLGNNMLYELIYFREKNIITNHKIIIKLIFISLSNNLFFEVLILNK